MTVNTRLVKGNRTDDKVIRVILPRKMDTLCLEPDVPDELSACDLIRSKHYVYGNYTDGDKSDKYEEMKEKVTKILTIIRVPKENVAAVKAIINSLPNYKAEEVTVDKSRKFKDYNAKMARVNAAIANADNEDKTGEGTHG